MFRRRRVTQYDAPPPTRGEYVQEEVVVPPPRRPLWWIWLVLLLALVLGGIALAYFLTRDSGPKTRVPNVVGLRTAAAVQRLGQRGYPAIVEGRVTTGATLGRVLSESPRAGTKLKRGRQVTIVVARGPSTIEVPNVVGLSEAQAFTHVQAAGLKGAAAPIASAQPKGRVVRQAPPGGAEAKKGSTVTLSISNGPALVTVPNVQGKTQAVATATLSRIGFKVAVTAVPASQPKGTVVTQTPIGGARAPKGSIVGLNVSGGPAVPPGGTNTNGKVPNVVGKSQRDALAVLEDAGYKAESAPVASSRPRGTVISQSPSAGATAPARSVVRIQVSLGSGEREPRTVPDVTGQTERTAKQTLVLAGFTVRTVDQPATTAGDNGIVLDQKPAGGESVPVGTQIVIYVGRLPSPRD